MNTTVNSAVFMNTSGCALTLRGSSGSSARHLKDKLQKAGFKAKVEKWESDSDSESDDEDLEGLMQ